MFARITLLAGIFNLFCLLVHAVFSIIAHSHIDALTSLLMFIIYSAFSLVASMIIVFREYRRRFLIERKEYGKLVNGNFALYEDKIRNILNEYRKFIGFCNNGDTVEENEEAKRSIREFLRREQLQLQLDFIHLRKGVNDE